MSGLRDQRRRGGVVCHGTRANQCSVEIRTGCRRMKRWYLVQDMVGGFHTMDDRKFPRREK